MVWWIAGGIVVAAFVVFLLVLLSMAGSLRELGHVLRALHRRALQAQALEPAVRDLQERAEALRVPLAAAEDRMELLQARREAD